MAGVAWEGYVGESGGRFYLLEFDLSGTRGFKDIFKLRTLEIKQENTKMKQNTKKKEERQ